MSNRRIYDREFKIQAVNLYKDSDKSIQSIENDLGVTNGNLGRWIQQYKGKGIDSFPGNGKVLGKDLEISNLKRETKILREERDILKKAMGIFSGNRR